MYTYKSIHPLKKGNNYKSPKHPFLKTNTLTPQKVMNNNKRLKVKKQQKIWERK